MDHSIECPRCHGKGRVVLFETQFKAGDLVRHKDFGGTGRDGIVEQVKDDAVVVNYDNGVRGEYGSDWFLKYANTLVLR